MCSYIHVCLINRQLFCQLGTKFNIKCFKYYDAESHTTKVGVVI